MDDSDGGPNSLAEGTALALRAHLLATARPELLVAADVKRNGGPDLVCWQWQPGKVWVWQLRYLHDPGTPQHWPPAAVLAAVAADPLSAGLDVVPGPSMRTLGLLAEQEASNMAEPEETVAVRDGPIPGLQLYCTAYQEAGGPDFTRREASMRAAKYGASRCNRVVAAARATSLPT
ncbi:hypothetical protein ACFFMM_11740 [Micromonospora chaiyaphumensis]|uniref:Uncharacterized protein n=1 Tax=Micromonospora chaiyaphumensis TaxID=307119 RepID=A0A1C4WAB2_9ACTN|nr:hypothetical protein [Micromonospora chaiyaphumensis]SCE93120.1 hypothetical protein GA0070214_103378 [Micromonospora chaiyaphumensis]